LRVEQTAKPPAMLETGGFALTLMPLLLEDIMALSNWLGRGAPTCVPHA